MIFDQAKNDSDFANPNILEVFRNLVFREYPYFRKIGVIGIASCGTSFYFGNIFFAFFLQAAATV